MIALARLQQRKARSFSLPWQEEDMDPDHVYLRSWRRQSAARRQPRIRGNAAGSMLYRFEVYSALSILQVYGDIGLLVLKRIEFDRISINIAVSPTFPSHRHPNLERATRCHTHTHTKKTSAKKTSRGYSYSHVAVALLSQLTSARLFHMFVQSFLGL